MADADPLRPRNGPARTLTDFLTKPLNTTELILRVRNLLQARALHRRLAEHNDQLAAELEAQRHGERAAARRHHSLTRRVRDVLDGRGLTMLFQPIVNLEDGTIVGAEALARFTSSLRPPDRWFADAHAVALGTELELLAVTEAIAQLDALPPDTFLSVNVSASTALDPHLAAVLSVVRGDRIVIELTEHTRVADYDVVVDALDRLRYQGIRIAVDDAGAGYAGLQHILRLRPDIIKLDGTLTSAVDSDPARRALAASQVAFGRDVGIAITAEGIETAEELDTLRTLGVTSGQGFYLGRPAPLPLPLRRSGEAPFQRPASRQPEAPG